MAWLLAGSHVLKGLAGRLAAGVCEGRRGLRTWRLFPGWEMNFRGHALLGEQHKMIPASLFSFQKGRVSLAWSFPQFD